MVNGTALVIPAAETTTVVTVASTKAAANLLARRPEQGCRLAPILFSYHSAD